MATKKLSNAEIKKKKCSYPDPPDEGLPIWMGTFADMMTLLFAFFVLLFSMSTLDPVKYSAFQNAQADKEGGTSKSSTSPLSQVEIKQELLDVSTEEISKKIEAKTIAEKEKELKNTNLTPDQMTKQIDDTKNELEEALKTPFKVSHDPRGVALEITGELCFTSGSTDLDAGIKVLLSEVASLMKVPNDTRAILVEGHTDNLPLTGDLQKKYKNNRGLSSFRASEVVTYLIDSLNVAKHRLVAVGYGAQWPAKVTWSQMRSGAVESQDLITKYNSNEYDEGTKKLKVKAEENRKMNRRIKIIFATK